MNQLKLFDDVIEKKAVNVATVHQLSPFRYPGGKTWLIPYVKKWLKSYGTNKKLIEPFAGGGIVSLTAAYENLVNHVLMVEIDEDISSVWQTIFGKDGRLLAKKIIDFELTRENIQKIVNRKNSNLLEQAFETILKNRLNRGGILAKGAGMVKNGENGKGIKSRWYPSTLARRILAIIEFKQKITFLCGDGLEIIKQYAKDKGYIFFIDPPYTVAGKRLYSYSEIDHNELFKITSHIKGGFLMTYDESEEIINLAQKYGFDFERILMKTTHHLNKYELLISRNLDWFKDL